MNKIGDIAELKAKISNDTSNLMNENDFDDNLRTGAIWSKVKILDQMVLNSE